MTNQKQFTIDELKSDRDDLLAALKAFVAAHDRGVPDHGGCCCGDCDNARGVIAKAEGRAE
jgi:hypothetical protein